MDADRLMIAEAVFKGLIGEEHLTQAEVDEFMGIVVEASMDRLMEQAADRGCNVFTGFEEDLIH